MSKHAKAKPTTGQKLHRDLDRLLAARQQFLKNENIIRLEKDGSISHETVRTQLVPRDDQIHKPEASARDSAAETSCTGQPAPNFYPETPESPQNGQQIDGPAPEFGAAADAGPSTKLIAAMSVIEIDTSGQDRDEERPSTGISIHEAPNTGQKFAAVDDNTATDQSAATDDNTADPLEELLARALSRPRRGRPAAFDEHNKGKLVALLSLGMSLRQAAAVLGVSHGTIRNTLKANPALAEEITAARFQAQLQPLACVIRESRRSWKAATWLLKYLDAKIASHEETPDERRERQQRETDEFLARSSGPHVKTRRILG